MSCMRCFCSCIWGHPDPGPVRLKDIQQVVLDTNRMGEPALGPLGVKFVSFLLGFSCWETHLRDRDGTCYSSVQILSFCAS